MVLNSLNFWLSEKLLISPSILNEIFARYSSLGCRFFPFSTLNTSCHPLLACRVSAERSAVKHMGFPLYVTCCFSLAAFNVLSLCLVFVSLISMSWHVCPWVYPVWDCSWIWLTISFSMLGKFSTIISKHFLIHFLFLFFFWDPYNSNVVAFDIVPEVSETILSSFHSFYFILLFRSYFHHFIFQLTDPFFCFRYSAIDSFRVINLSNCVVYLCMFILNSSRSLLIDSCIFSILFSRFWSSLLSLFWILFQVVCLFPLHLFWLLCF